MKTFVLTFVVLLYIDHIIIAQNFEFVGNSYPVSNLSSQACSLSDTCFTLTDNAIGQVGAVWDLDLINLNNNFDVSFCMYLGNSDSGADGFAFVMRKPGSSNYGASGEGVGYGTVGAIQGISPSVAVEFDTYKNQLPSDISADHTTLVFNGNLNAPMIPPISLSSSGANVEDNNFHVARLVWDASAKKLKMYFDAILRFDYNGDIVANVFNGDPNLIWGFTSSTGGSANLQQICFPTIQSELPDHTICKGDSVTIHFYKPGITAYSWTNSVGQNLINWNNTTGTTLTDTSFTASTSDVFYLNYTFNNLQYKDSVKVTVIDPSATNNGPICLGQNLQLTTPFIDNVSYKWTSPNTISANIQNPLYLNLNQTTTFTLQIMINDTNICTTTTTVVVDTTKLNLGVDISFCNDFPKAITATYNVNNLALIWSTGATSNSIIPQTSGEYYVTALTSLGCQLKDSIEVTIYPTPNAVISGNITSGLAPLSVVFSNASTNANNYFWDLGNGQLSSVTTLSDTSLTYQIAGLYIAELIAYNDNCSDTAWLEITVIDTLNISISEPLIFYVPNSFTPDGDDFNNLFIPVFTSGYDKQDYHFQIFNRWGELIFKTTEVNAGWDGMYKGQIVQDGVYTWTLEFKNEINDKKYAINGHCNLLR